MKRVRIVFVVLSAAIFAALIANSILLLPQSPVRLAELVAGDLHRTGVENPVTAVLLNYRGYDTLLEIGVLFLALLAVLAATDVAASSGSIPSGPRPLLQAATRRLIPLMILIAGYLLWAGSDRPGGAFQASAVLAAATVLLYLSGLVRAWGRPGPWLRIGITGGFLYFLATALALLKEGNLLRYPPEHAGALIIMVESALAVSVGLILSGLFLWLPNEQEEPEE